MSTIVLVVVMAITVEAIIEYGKTIAKAFESGEHKAAITQVIAIALSVFLCFCVGADMYEALGVQFAVKYIGFILTGVFASRGSNYVSDFVKKIQETTKGVG